MDPPAEISKKSKKRTRRGKRKKASGSTLTTPVEHLTTAVPQSTSASGTIPIFDYGITTADPAATWALFQTLSIHQDSMAEIREAVGLPRLQDIPYRLGSGPRASLPPWTFFPPAPSTTDAPAQDPGPSHVDPAEMLTAASRPDVPAPSSALQDADFDALYHAAVAEFDPDMDDLLDD